MQYDNHILGGPKTGVFLRVNNFATISGRMAERRAICQ